MQPCGGAIPLCMVEEFNLPTEIIDRKVTKMKMISPSNREVDVGKTLSEREYIGMCRREVFDDYLRQRAVSSGTNVINGLMMGFQQDGTDGPFKLRYNDFSAGGKVRAAARRLCCAPLARVASAESVLFSAASAHAPLTTSVCCAYA